MKENLPIRKNIRLKYYDYSKEGYYFVTICIKDRIKLLGEIQENIGIKLTKEGKVAEKYIKNIEQIYKNVRIDEYVVMPNHIHVIIAINKQEEVTISRIIKQYKMQVCKEIGYKIWQKLFHEHIIRTEFDYLKIKTYIQNNVANWKEDRYS